MIRENPPTPSRFPILHVSAQELAERSRLLRGLIAPCGLCPRQCGVDRTAGQKGYCRAGECAKVASHNVHHGEEPPISGSKGSGTIFFAHCTMRCVFCQNYPISQLGNGREVTDEELAGLMLNLQGRGCHNINLVTPSHYLHAFAAALCIARERGLMLPIVYNTSGYERVETLRLLDGLVDIYLPDIKYWDPAKAARYSDAPDFIEHNVPALQEMFRQVGVLECDSEGIARRGMIVRHLVLPEAEEDSMQALKMLIEHVSPEVHVSLMSQYFPAHKAPHLPPLHRRVDPQAYLRVVDFVEHTRLRGWIQPLSEA